MKAALAAADCSVHSCYCFFQVAIAFWMRYELCMYLSSFLLLLQWNFLPCFFTAHESCLLSIAFEVYTYIVCTIHTKSCCMVSNNGCTACGFLYALLPCCHHKLSMRQGSGGRGPRAGSHEHEHQSLRKYQLPSRLYYNTNISQGRLTMCNVIMTSNG